MEVGIEDCLHIEFEYDKGRYHLRDTVVGKIYFLLVRIKLKHMEVWPRPALAYMPCAPPRLLEPSWHATAAILSRLASLPPASGLALIHDARCRDSCRPAVPQIEIKRRETTGQAMSTRNESETLAKYEIMDGAPVRGESIPIRCV